MTKTVITLPIPLKVTAISDKGYDPITGYLMAIGKNGIIEIKDTPHAAGTHIIVGSHWTLTYEMESSD